MLHLPLYVQGAWLIGAVMFIFGLKGMGSPTTARKGIIWAGVGMLVAIIGTFLVPDLNNIALIKQYCFDFTGFGGGCLCCLDFG